MMNIKNRLLALMRSSMINCEEATRLVTREDLEQLSLRQKTNLLVHMMSCKHCRNYRKQLHLIARSLNIQVHNTEKGRLTHRLSDKERSSLQRVINNKIHSK
jgi:hypothetical protein